MLALLAAPVGAPGQLLEPSRPQLARKLCVSRAVDVKSVTCNLQCQALSIMSCPEACVCSEPTETSADLSVEMYPSDEYKGLLDRLFREVHEDRDVRALPTTALRLLPTTSAARAEVPQQSLGYYVRTWLCKDHQNKTDWECAGPSGKNINVVFSGHAVIEKALDAAQMKGKGVECVPKEQKYCDKMADYMVSTTHEAKSREEAETMMIAPGSKSEALCKKCFAPAPEVKDVPHPFSPKVGLYQGIPFLALGGASGNGVFTVERLDESFGSQDGLDAVKDMGFQGACFSRRSRGIP